MEAYTNCRQFNCVTPIVEQAEYHMFCREKCELYLPEMYNKIGVGLMAWGPLSMALGEAQNGERLLFPKGSFKTKSHSYSWTEDEVNKNVSIYQTYIVCSHHHIFCIKNYGVNACRNSDGQKRRQSRSRSKTIAYVTCKIWPKNWAAVPPNYPLHGHWNTNRSSVYCWAQRLPNNYIKVCKLFR